MPVIPESNQAKALHQATTPEARSTILGQQIKNEGKTLVGSAFGGPVAGLKAALELLDEGELEITGDREGDRKIDVSSG